MRLGTIAEWSKWFFRGRHLWGSILLVAAGLAFWKLSGGTGEDLRRVGLIYQLVGTVVVLVDIRDAMRRHGIKPFLVRFVRYFATAPIFRRDAKVTLVGASACSISLGRVRATGSLGPGASVEQRLVQIENSLAAIADQFDRVERQVETETAERKAAQAAEAEARRTSLEDMSLAIRHIEVGSIDLSIFGLIWLLTGTLMTTATPEMCIWVLHCAR